MKVGAGTATTLSSPGYTIGATSINVASTTNYPTDTGVTITIDEVDGTGERIAGTRNVFIGDVASATQINELAYSGGDANRNYSASATTRVYIEVNEIQMNRMIDGILVAHDQDGTLKAGAVDNAGVLANDVVTTAKILDANVTTAKIADASVTNAKLATTTGEPGGAWEDWTPTLTSLSGGTLSVSKYKIVGKTVFFTFRYTLAGAGMGTNPRFTLPVTAAAHTAITDTNPLAIVSILDSGTARYAGVCSWSSTTQWAIQVNNCAGTYQVATQITSTVPFTWATGDYVMVQGTYEAA